MITSTMNDNSSANDNSNSNSNSDYSNANRNSSTIMESLQFHVLLTAGPFGVLPLA